MDDVIYGWTIAAFSVVFLILYLPLLIIFFVDREFRRSTAYVIMTHIAVTDFLQLVVHLYSGILVILQTQPNYWVDKIFGAILTGLWFSMLMFTLYLNYNRISTILLNRFRKANCKETNLVLFALCYLSFLVPLVLKLLPDNNYFFVMAKLSWGPPTTDKDLSRIMRAVSNYLILVVALSSVFTYVAIFSYISFMRKTKLTKREYMITMQVSFVIGYLVFSFMYWNYLGYIIPMVGHFFDFLSMMVWLVMNGIHALIYLIFNERLRSCFFGLVFHGKMPESVSSQNILIATHMPAKSTVTPMRTMTDTT